MVHADPAEHFQSGGGGGATDQVEQSERSKWSVNWRGGEGGSRAPGISGKNHAISATFVNLWYRVRNKPSLNFIRGQLPPTPPPPPHHYARARKDSEREG